MNPDSLCAKCIHIKKDPRPNKPNFCFWRNKMNRFYPCIYIKKGFKTCINFEPRKEHQ